MHIYNFKEGDLFIADDIVADDELETEEEAQDKFDKSLRIMLNPNPLFREFIDLYGKSHDLERYAVLSTHGGSYNNKWIYFDGNKSHYVQNWIDTNDGNYSALFLFMCNDGAFTPRSEQSLLVVPDRRLNETPNVAENSIYGIVVPRANEVDSNTVEYEVAQLRERLEQPQLGLQAQLL